MAGSGKDPWLSMTNATHYVLDGIPMRVAENYRPKIQKKNTLPPLRLSASQSKALNFKYEFETEKGFIHWHEALLAQAELTKQEKQKKKENAERLRQEEEETEKLRKEAAAAAASAAASTAANMVDSKVSKSGENPQQKSVTFPPPLKPNPPVVPVISNAILLPQRASPVTVTTNSQTQSQTSGVNIQDFETLAEDPFDNLELESINDMKELESVLANTQALQGAIGGNINQNSNNYTLPDSSSHGSDVLSDSKAEESIYENPSDISMNPNKGDIYENLQSLQPLPTDETSTLRKKKGPIAAPRSRPTSDSKVTHVENDLNRVSLKPVAQFNCQTEAVNIGTMGPPEPSTKPRTNIPAKPPPPTKPKPKPTVECKPTNDLGLGPATTSKPVQPQSNSKIQSLANAITKDLGNAISRPPGAPKGFSYVSTSVNGISTDDKRIVKDIEWPSLDQQTPTPKADDISSPFTIDAPPTYNDTVHKSQSEQLEPAPATAAKTMDVSKNGASRLVPQRPAPARPAPPRFASPSSSPRSSALLQDTSSQVVDSLLSMGFERAQITAAMKHIGSDTKKLVDHLCAVQKLTSNGSKWQSAEQAVMICGTDISKAEKFAKAYQQLQEFGFGDDKIKEALLGCDMDMQKALDQLV